MIVNKNLSEVQSLIEPIIADLGLIFVDIELKKTHGELNLFVYIDKEGGVTIDDCENVSRAIDLPLDEIDFTKGQSYNLNVSSPGLDRPLKNEADFNRYLNKEIEVKFYKPQIDNNKTISAVLISHSTDDFTVMYNNNEVKINKKDTAKIMPVIKF